MYHICSTEYDIYLGLTLGYSEVALPLGTLYAWASPREEVLVSKGTPTPQVILEYPSLELRIFNPLGAPYHSRPEPLPLETLHPLGTLRDPQDMESGGTHYPETT